MNNMKILSEINLPELEQAGFIVEKLNYGNRLYNYLFHKHRCKILRKLPAIMRLQSLYAAGQPPQWSAAWISRRIS